MRKLETTIKLRRMGYNQPVFSHLLERDDVKAIYEVKHPVDDKFISYYEVFKIAIAQPRKLPNGEVLPVRELYPGHEDFGVTAWCFKYSGRAWAKFEEI